MIKNGVVRLENGNLVLEISKGTGKLLALKWQGQGTETDLLVVPHESERQASLTPTANNVFDAREAFGGDECFPTVSGFSHWNLRDHGELWGRTAEVQSTQGNVTTVWPLASQKAEFRRSIASLPLLGDRKCGFLFDVEFPAFYSVEIAGTSSCVESLYASHALFSAEEGDVLVLAELSPEDLVQWNFSGNAEFLKMCIKKGMLYRQDFPEKAKPSAQKFYAQSDKKIVSLLHKKNANMTLVISQETGLPCTGIWWCNNGWGDGRDHRTIGIEPTTHATDGPIFASTRGDISTKNVSFRWEVVQGRDSFSIRE
jgi:hypothetical protein